MIQRGSSALQLEKKSLQGVVGAALGKIKQREEKLKFSLYASISFIYHDRSHMVSFIIFASASTVVEAALKLMTLHTTAVAFYVALQKEKVQEQTLISFSLDYLMQNFALWEGTMLSTEFIFFLVRVTCDLWWRDGFCLEKQGCVQRSDS